MFLLLFMLLPCLIASPQSCLSCHTCFSYSLVSAVTTWPITPSLFKRLGFYLVTYFAIFLYVPLPVPSSWASRVFGYFCILLPRQRFLASVSFSVIVCCHVNFFFPINKSFLFFESSCASASSSPNFKYSLILAEKTKRKHKEIKNRANALKYTSMGTKVLKDLLKSLCFSEGFKKRNI